MQKGKLCLVFIIGILLLTSFVKPKKKDLWQELAVIQELAKTEKRPILIDMYTDWCIYCKKMDVSVYRNDSVYQYLKDYYYRWKFNAETKENIEWNGQTFSYNTQYKVNDLAAYLTQGYISFPTTIIIPVKGRPYFLPGQLGKGEMEALLTYFTQETHTVSIDDYLKNYKPTWK